MFERFIDWINKAFNKPTPQNPDRKEGDEVPFELDKYAPRFIEEDHKAARTQGYLDAWDKYQWEIGGKLADEGAKKRKRQAKAQVRADLEGESLSYDELGELSETVQRLPREPDHRPEPQIQVPKDVYTRNAQIQGMVNRLIKLDEKLQAQGLSLFDEGADVPAEYREMFVWAQMARQRVARRLAAFGEDPTEIEDAIQRGELVRVDEVAPPDDPSDDPDVRRVEAMYEAEREGLDRGAVERRGEEASRAAKAESSKRRDSATSPGWGRDFDDHERADGGGRRENEQHVPRSNDSSGGPKRPIKWAEVAGMRERLLEVDESLEDMGYVKNHGPILVKSCDRGAVDRLLIEREHLVRELAAWGENPQEVESDLDERRTPRVIEDNGPGSSLDRYVRSVQGEGADDSDESDCEEDEEEEDQDSESDDMSEDEIGENENAEADGTVGPSWDTDEWGSDPDLGAPWGGWL